MPELVHDFNMPNGRTVELTVEYYWEKPYRGSLYEPPSGGIDDFAIRVNGTDITDILKDSFVEEVIEQVTLWHLDN